MADDVKEQPENPVIHGMLLFPGTTKEQIDTFPRLIARENDIFINTYMKAGTTWTQEIVWQIIHNGKIDYRRLDIRMPWLDGMAYNLPFNPYYAASPVMIERLFKSFPSPRVFKTHLPYDLVPKPCDQATKPRYIYVMRNPKDTAVSYFHFNAGFSRGANVSWDEFFELFMKGEGRNEPIWRDLILEEKGGNQAFTSFISNPTNGHLIRPCADVSGSAQISGVSAEIGDVKAESLNTAEYHYLVYFGAWFDHVLSWWKHKDDPNILFVKYEDIRKDSHGAVQKIAKFIGKELSHEILEHIVNQTSLNAMKKEEHVNYTWMTEFKGDFIRKGQVGDWKNYFTEEQNKRFDSLYAKKIAGSGLEFEFDI